MPHRKRVGAVFVAVVALVALVPGAAPASPGDTGQDRPEEAGNGATSDGEPGTGATYWTEERMRNAKPAQMPNPNR